ncbi:MAG: helix-turn-helix transcriptional regulator [Clostridiales bacterium]|nr:helix-turn-helix transcriptional regulator [Clostridiales bacterium]
MNAIQKLKINELTHTDFDIRNITSRHEDFMTGIENNYLSYGREHNLLHIVTSGKRLYISEERFIVPTGTIIFIPEGTRYITRALANRDCGCSGIGICFDLYGADGNKLALEQGIMHDWSDYHNLFIKLFLDISQCCRESSYYVLRTKSLMFQLLSRLTCDNGADQLTRSIIAPALTFIAGHYCDNLPVKAYADTCNMSESYFRKKFIEYTGMSPIEYRNQLRFSEARRLYSEGLGLQEIAEVLGFSDAGYLCKLYRRRTGVSIKDDSNYDVV